MPMTSRASERVGLVGQISPQSTTTALTSGWISMANFDRLLAKIIVGTLGSSATVNAKLQQATSSGGAGAKDITGKAITQFSQSVRSVEFAGRDRSVVRRARCHQRLRLRAALHHGRHGGVSGAGRSVGLRSKVYADVELRSGERALRRQLGQLRLSR